MIFIKKWLTPPVFEDEEKTHQAYLLHTILLALIIIPIPYVIYILIQMPEESNRALAFVLGSEILNIIPFIMLRRGYVRPAAVIQIATLWLFFISISATSSGVYGLAYLLGNGLVITISGILLGGRGALAMTLLAMLEGGIMVYAELHGWTPPDVLDDPLPTWIVSVVLFSVGAVLQHLASHTLRKTLDRASASEEKYRLISRVSSDYTFATEVHKDGSADLSWVAGAFEKMTGYNYEEYVKSGSWVGHVHPEDLEKDAQDMEKLHKNQDIKSEIRTFTKNGEVRWEQIFAHPVWGERENRLIGIFGAVRDITEQKKTEMALAYERDLLQIFMDNIPDSIYFKDTESRFIRVNQAQARFLGVDNPQDAINKTDLDFQSSELARKFILEEKQLMETGQVVLNRMEFNPTNDGKPRWLSATKVPVKNERGQTIGMIGISRDVTEQKKAEELEQRRRAMLENVIKLGQEITQVNNINTTLEKIWHGVHEGLHFDRLAIFLYNSESSSLERALGTDMQGNMEKAPGMSFPVHGSNRISQVFNKPDGLYFTRNYDIENKITAESEMYGVKDFASVAVWAGDKPVAVLCVDHLLTQLPISETQLEALRLFAGYVGLAIENARLNTALQTELSQRGETLLKQSAILNGIPDMAWLKGRDSRYIAINEQFAKVAGMKVEEIPGKTDFDIWPKNYAEKYHNDDLEIMQTRQRMNTEELQHDRTGREFWVETTKTPILNASGEVIGTTGIAREITARKKAEEIEQQRRIMLEKVVKLGKQVTESDDLPSTIKKIWHGVHDDLGFDRLAVFLFNPELNTMDDTVGTNNAGEMVDHRNLSFPIDSTFANLLQNPNAVYFTNNYDVENKIPENHEMYGIKDYVAVAAWAGDKPVAVICADHGITHRPISAEQVEALRLFGGYAGLAIENARLNEKIQAELSQQIQAKEREEHRREILEKVVRLGQRVSEVHDLRATLLRIWHGVHDDLGFDRVGIYLYNHERNSMDGTFGTNNQGEMIDEWHTWFSLQQDTRDSNSFLRVFEKPDTIFFTDNFENDYNIPPGHNMSGVKGHASIGTWAGEKPVAVISVDHRITGRPFTEEQLEGMRLFAGYAGLAIENSRLKDEIENELMEQKKAEETEQRRRVMMEKVIKLGKQVTAVSDFETTLRNIWNGVRYDLDFDRVGLFLYNSQENTMDGAYGTDRAGKIWNAWHVKIGLGANPLIQDAIVFHKVLDRPDGFYFTKDYEGEFNLPPDHSMAGVKYYAVAAVWAGNKPVAIISVDQLVTGRAFTDEQLEALRLFAGYAGLAISNVNLNAALEKELVQRQNFINELETKNAELERFTYTVSHDLKSPLVTIRGFLGYLLRDAQGGDFEKFKHDTHRIETAVEKMQNLLQDLLELSRIGRLMNTPIEIPFNEIVKDALEIVDGQIKARNVLIDYKSTSITIKCDRVRLAEVLQNLIDNAIKFMGDQPDPHIEIGSFINDSNEKVFYVKDNGIGIAPEFHGKIFGLFDKLTTDSEGTGIGLALVKRIIEVHGGRIWIESQAAAAQLFISQYHKAGWRPNLQGEAMCGRFTLTVDPAEFQDTFGDFILPKQFAPRFNIAPTQPVLAIPNDGKNKADFFLWGLIPSWSKDPAIANKLINARGETIAEKPSFRGGFKYKRCLILTDGFYEWKAQEGAKTKTPYFIHMKDGKPFAFAGLWDEWNSPDGDALRTCTIITITPNKLMSTLHNRMPVILDQQNYTDWLDPAPRTPDSLLHLIQPFPADGMSAYPVSTMVNSPGVDRAELVLPA